MMLLIRDDTYSKARHLITNRQDRSILIRKLFFKSSLETRFESGSIIDSQKLLSKHHPTDTNQAMTTSVGSS